MLEDREKFRAMVCLWNYWLSLKEVTKNYMLIVLRLLALISASEYLHGKWDPVLSYEQ